VREVPQPAAEAGSGTRGTLETPSDYCNFLAHGRGRPDAGTPVATAAQPSTKVQNVAILTKEQLAHIQSRLLEERARSLRSLGLFDRMAKEDRESGDSNLAAYTDHMADQGTEAMEREKAALFATKEGRYLYRIEDALRRLYSDPENFGRCQATGKPINFRRLDALPHARYCIEYKRELEARGE